MARPLLCLAACVLLLAVTTGAADAEAYGAEGTASVVAGAGAQVEREPAASGSEDERAPERVGDEDAELCVAGEGLLFGAPMSILRPPPRLVAPAAADDRAPSRPARTFLCVGGTASARDCSIEDAGGSRPDPRPDPRSLDARGGAASLAGLVPPSPRLVPPQRSRAVRVHPGYARGIDRPPRG